MHLVKSIVRTFEFATKADAPEFRPDYLNVIEQPIAELLYLIVECSLFVREYARHKRFLGTSHIKNLSLACLAEKANRALIKADQQ